MRNRKNLLVSLLATLAAVAVLLGFIIFPSVANGQPNAATAPATTAATLATHPAEAPAVAPAPVAALAAPVVAATPATPAVTPVAAPTAPAAPVVANDVTVSELKDSIVNVVNQWKTIGWVAGLIALVGFLMLALRIKPLNDWLDAKNLTQYKSWVAAFLGAVSTGLIGYSQGVGIWQAIILGIGAGLAAVGGHQVLTRGNPPADTVKPA